MVTPSNKRLRVLSFKDFDPSVVSTAMRSEGPIPLQQKLKDGGSSPGRAPQLRDGF